MKTKLFHLMMIFIILYPHLRPAQYEITSSLLLVYHYFVSSFLRDFLIFKLDFFVFALSSIFYSFSSHLRTDFAEYSMEC